LLLQSLNKVIDLDAARWMAFQDQVPVAVICVITAVSLLAAMVVGYTFGLGGLRQPFSIFVLSLAITIVLALTIDLDWPHEGIIRVSQQPMLDLQKQLQSVRAGAK
jgi:hypothetical protein